MILFRKMLRTLWRGKKAYLSCIMLLAVGIAMFLSFHLLNLNLNSSMAGFYGQQRFAHAFARVTEAPRNDVYGLARLEGVAYAQPALVLDARVQGLPLEKNVTLRLNSFEPGESEALNIPLLEQGGMPGEGELLLGESFAQANGLVPGDTLTLVLRGKEITRRVSGTAISPEYVYAMPDSSQLMPDNQAFGIAFVPYADLAAFSGKPGVANSVSFLLEQGYTYEELQYSLEDALSPFGLQSLVGRADQASHLMLQMEVEQLGGMATSIPMLFVGMAVIILYIMLKRIVEQERAQIGTLKAFGFSDRQIMLHYTSYGLVIGLLGGGLGILGGSLLAGGMSSLYLVYFSLPDFSSALPTGYFFAGFGLALGAGGLGACAGTRALLRLTPAQAMRPSAPPVVKKDLLAWLPFLRPLLDSSGQMALRNLARSKFRSAFVVMGLSFSFSLLAVMASYNYMVDAMLLEQFTKVQVFDVSLQLEQPAAYVPAMEAAWSLEGTTQVQGLLELPVELSHQHLKKNAVLTALEEGQDLYRIYNSTTGQVLEPPREGLVLSRSLADQLGVRRGDLIRMKTPYTGEERIALPVMDVIDANLGLAAYLELDAACELLEMPRTVSTLALRTNSLAQVKEDLLKASNVASFTDTAAARQVYDELLETYAGLLWLMQAAAMGIAFAIISNTASISLSERGREYATLRVVGMHPAEIARTLRGEYRLLTLVGIGLGIPLTRLLKEAMAGVMSNDIFTLPVYTPASSYLVAAAACLVTVELCGLAARRNIGRLNMVEVLKERE